MSKKYCGDDWENCKPKLSDQPSSEKFDKMTDAMPEEIKPLTKKSLTSKKEVKKILES